MSSAANHKRGPLEEEFQRRMHDAEASPSPDLWARIDHDLTIQESNHYKGRMVFYRQLAAACFVLFAMAGALLTYHFKEDEATAIASVKLDADSSERKALATTEEASPAWKNMAEEAPAVASIASPATGSAAVASDATSKRTPKHYERAPEANGAYFAAESNDTHSNSAAGALAVEAGNATTDNYSFTISGDGGGNTPEAKSAFASLRPFYQTARQAIAAVPPSFNNSFGKAAELSNNTQPKSVVELSRSAKEEITATLRKSEELAIALNNNPAKEDDKKGDADSPWTLGMGYAPSYFNQNIGMPEQMMGTVSRYSLVADGPDKTIESSENMDKARNEFEENTDPAFSYAVDVKAGFKLGKKLRLLSGIGFTQNTSRTKSSYIIKQFWIKPNTNERVALPATTVFLPSLNNNFSTDSLSVDKTDDFYVNYRYRHVTLPVGLQYEGGINKEWFWYTSGGVAANFLVETTVMASNDEVKDVNYDHGDESPFRKVQFSGNLSLGVGKRVSNAVSVTAGPEFRGYFNSLLAEPDKALAPQGRPYTIGVNMSVNYDLGRR